ncbi:Ig-like domain-containing protein, partial [Methanosphaera cuniculi]
INNTKNNTITGNILIADLLVGDESVKTTTADADNITGNTPLYRNYVIDDTTYNTYFNNDGTINVPEDKPIHLLIGNLNNKTLILNNNKDITIMNYYEIILHNITIKTEGNTTLNLTNITITNTNQKPVLEIRGIKATITYTNLTTNNNIIIFENTQYISIRNNNFITNVTNDVKAISIKNVVNIDSYNNNITITANITQDNKEHTIVAIDGINLTSISYFNIIITNLNEVNDNIVGVNIVNPERYDNRLSVSKNKIQIKGFNNVCAINMINQTLSITENTIQISAKNTIAMNITTSKATGIYNDIESNTINMISTMNNTGIILNSCENMAIRETNFTNIMSKNITGIQVNNSTNMQLLGLVMNLNGNNIIAINLNNTSKIDITLSNITVNTNINQAPIILNSAEEILIANNSIITTTENTIKIDEKSSKSIIENNVLYALKLGDDSVLKENNNYIVVIDNTPVKSYKNLLLNDYTYDGFFDENGVLRDEIPTGANITLTGNLYNRVLNITRPVNLIGNDVLSLINTTIIVNAKNTNITNIYMKGYDNTKLIINANNCNINIPKINMQNTINENITLITLNGNNNNISITDISTTNQENNANITLLKITGKQNSITIGSMKANNFTNSTAIKLDNADKNYLNISGRVQSTVILAMDTGYGIILNNSNYNNIITSTIVSSRTKNVGFLFSNSSNNIIYNARFEGLKEKALILENNSNYNKIFGLRISFSTLNMTPISIINSSHNILEGNSITFTGEAYPVEILNGFENEIKYNALSSTTYKGDNGVYQKTDDDNAPQNNIISENYNSVSNLGSYIGINSNGLPLKIHQTITLTARPVDFTFKGGNFTFIVNGKEIGTVETQKTENASINYTITGKEGDKLIVTVIVRDTQLKVVTNTSVSQLISKLDSNILLPNIISDNGKTTISAIVLDEEGNIQTSGKVAIKLNGKTQGVVDINNGIAQLTVDSSKLSAKNYTITAVYGGNSMTEKSTSDATLTITKTTPKITIETTNVKRTNNTTITVKLTDDQNNNIAGNTKVAVKLNGKTITHTTSQNGIIKINMDLTQYKNSQYDLTIVSGENNRYNTARMTTKLAIE